jgi:PAS domain S-box-containing protein
LFSAPGPLAPPSPEELSFHCPESFRWAVDQVYSFADAAEALAAHPYDIIVMDVSLQASAGTGPNAPLGALETARQLAPDATLVALLPDGADGTLGLARRAFMMGAQDALTRTEAASTEYMVRVLRTASERKAADRAVEQVRGDYARLVDNAPIGIFRTSPDGRYLSVNRALAEIYGYGHPETLMVELTDIGNQLYVEPERRSEFARLLSFSGRLDGFESQIHRRDGSVIWISEAARAVHDDDGKVLFYEGFVRDITPRKRAEEKLKQANETLEASVAERTKQLRQEITERRFAEESLRQAKEQAEAAARTKTRFLANMSHELRTPLNAILGFAQLLEVPAGGAARSEVDASHISHIRGAGEHLLSLINDLLDLSKIDADEFDLDIEEVDVPALLYDACTMVEPRAAVSGCTIVTDLPRMLPPLRADRRRLAQVLINVVGNAAKFTPEGGTVRLSAAVNDCGEFEILIADDGIGMDPADIPRALSEFGQVGDATKRNSDGTGLGLPLSKRLTELHDGTFTLTSAPGEGTEILITFPPSRIATA